MTALSIPRTHVRVTTFERVLLRVSAATDRYVASRIARRTGDAARAALATRESVADARSDARALGGLGIPPR